MILRLTTVDENEKLSLSAWPATALLSADAGRVRGSIFMAPKDLLSSKTSQLQRFFAAMKNRPRHHQWIPAFAGMTPSLSFPRKRESSLSSRTVVSRRIMASSLRVTKPAAYSSRAASRRSAISSSEIERPGLTNRRRRCWARAIRLFSVASRFVPHFLGGLDRELSVMGQTVCSTVWRSNLYCS